MSIAALTDRPVIMSFSAHDPCGASGIQADIETLGALRCHVCTIVTALLTRDTANIQDIAPCPTNGLVAQARMILADLPVKAFKLGFLGSIENVSAIHTILSDYPHIPVILEISAEQQAFGEHLRPIWDAVQSLLFSHTHILMINTPYARSIAQGADTLDACAQEIMARGPSYLMMIGDQDGSRSIRNTLYGNYRQLDVFDWARTDYDVIGQSSTLTAAIAGFTAQGLSANSAVREAQAYAYQAVLRSNRYGMGAHIPDRFYWADALINEGEDT